MVGGKYFIGVNFGAMDKYREPLTAEQWKHCVASLKVLVSLLSSLQNMEICVCRPFRCCWVV